MHFVLNDKNIFNSFVNQYTNKKEAINNYFFYVYQRKPEYLKHIFLSSFPDKNTLSSNCTEIIGFDPSVNKFFILDCEVNKIEYFSIDESKILIEKHKYNCILNCHKFKFDFENNMPLNNSTTQDNVVNQLSENINNSTTQENVVNQLSENTNNKDINNKDNRYNKLADLFLNFEPIDDKKNILVNQETPTEYFRDNKITKDSQVILSNNNKEDNKKKVLFTEETLNKSHCDEIIIINDEINVDNYNKNTKTPKKVEEIIIDPLLKTMIPDNLMDNENNNVSKDQKKIILKKMLGDIENKYLSFLQNNKKIKQKISNLDFKLTKFKKEKDFQLFSNLRKLREEYFQYKKIKYVDDKFTIERLEENLKIPNTFVKIYDFITNASENPKIKQLFEDILKIDIENLFASFDLNHIDKNILLLSNNYNKLKNDLHVKFNSDYDYLEEEMISNNKSI